MDLIIINSQHMKSGQESVQTENTPSKHDLDKQLVVEDLSDILSTINMQKSKLNKILRTVKLEGSPADGEDLEDETPNRSSVMEMIQQEQTEADARFQNMCHALYQLKQRVYSLEDLDSTDADIANQALDYCSNYKRRGHRRYISEMPPVLQPERQKLPLLSVTPTKSPRLTAKEIQTETQPKEDRSRICSACVIF